MPRVNITSEPVVKYLEALAKLGVYGTQAGAVATNICRQEVMRLIEKGVLKPIPFPDGAKEEED